MSVRQTIFLTLVLGVMPLAACEATQKVAVGTTEVPVVVVPSVVQGQQCDANRLTIETAIDAYTAMKGEAPKAGDDLVTAGLLKEFPSDEYTIDASSGTAVLTGIGVCAGK